MEQESSNLDARTVADRTKIQEQLLKNVEITDDEKSFLLMASQLKDTWSETVTALYSSKMIKHALEDHASALVKAAEAADKSARGLKIATWVLACATVVLAAATVVLAFATVASLWLATKGN